MSKYIDLHSIAETVNETNEHEPTNNTQNIVFNKPYCGILHLDKSYGIRGKKHYYKCVPYDKDVPYLIVPYEKKIGFSKTTENIYVQFQYTDIVARPPKGTLLKNYGNCAEDINYFDYLYEANDLNVSHKKIKDVLHLQKESKDLERILSQYDKDFEKIDESSFVFSIDGSQTRDMDDAFSVERRNRGYKVNIYITNIHIWLDHFEFWPHIKNMFSSVYLPHKAHWMFPPAFSEEYCSLLEGTQRMVINYSFFINDDGNVEDFSVRNAIIKMNKNFVYEDEALLRNPNYIFLMEVTKKMENSVENSRDLVQFWMEKVCAFVGERYKTGIFVRRQQTLEQIVGNIGQPFYLRSGDYLQVTSPLRKIVDLLNSICVVQPSLIPRIDYLFLDFDRLELTRKRTKKVENGCKLLHLLESCGEIISDVEYIKGDYYKICELGKIVRLNEPASVKIQRFDKNIDISLSV